MKGRNLVDLKNEYIDKLNKEDALERLEKTKFSIDVSYQGDEA